jgi:hypothetical protein
VRDQQAPGAAGIDEAIEVIKHDEIVVWLGRAGNQLV